MGLLNNIGEKFSNTIWSSVNTMTDSMARTANQYLVGSGEILNTGINSGSAAQFNQIDNKQYFDHLKHYHIVSALLDVFCSCIKDVLGKSDFHVQITGDEDHTIRANKFIDSIQLKRYVMDNLKDMVYHGVYAFGIDYQKQKLYSLIDPYDCKIMTNTQDIIGYEVGGKLISNDNLVCYYYQMQPEDSIGSNDSDDSNPFSILNSKKEKDTDKELENKKPGEVIRDDDGMPSEISDLVVKFKRNTPYGIFDGKLFRIFQMYSLEVALYMMSLRESMKPTLLGMSTGGRQINLANSIDMANQVEEILNAPINNLAQMGDPTLYINQIVWTVLNNIRVLPTLDQYQNLTDMAQNDTSGKREKLAQELDNIKKEILQELTIPEELMGGSANRWEQYGRNDRFMTTIDNFLYSISTLVKQIICKYTGISTVSISFNIDTTALTASMDTKNKINTLAEKMADISRVLQNVKEIVENEYVNPSEAYSYIVDQVGAIDEKLKPVFIAKLNEMNDNEEDEDSGGEDSEGGDDFDL